MTNWGNPGTALLPKSLRELWTEESIPGWIAKDSKLLEGTKLGEFGAEIWKCLPGLTERLERYLLALVDTRIEAVNSLPALGRPWPPTLDPNTVPWRTRTRNCLRKAGLLTDKSQLSRITFGELLMIPGMGTVSLLDFAVTAEAAIDRQEQPVPAKGNAMTDLMVLLMNAPWAELITAEDPRFAPFFPGKHGTLSQNMEAILASGSTAVIDDSVDNSLLGQRSLFFLEEDLKAIFSRVQEIEQMPLDVALHQYLAVLSDAQGLRLNVLLSRLGWNGSPPATLRASATAMNVSFERIRQIQEKVMKKRPSHPIFLPALEHALKILAEVAPLDIESATELLKERGITTVPFHPESVLSAADFCGYAATFNVEIKNRHSSYIVTNSTLTYANKVKLLARKLSGASGVSNITVVSAATLHEEPSVSAEQVRDVLQKYNFAQFLDEHAEWFWMPDGKPNRNRLNNVTRRMLAVTNRLDLGVLREGLRRSYMYRFSSKSLIVPPRSILAAFYAANRTFVLDENDQVSSSVPLDYRIELGATEQVLVEVLRSTPSGILDRQAFINACEERGVNTNTLNAFLSFSPIIQIIDSGIWSLRGTNVNPIAVEAMRESLALRSREHRIGDYGWTSDGNLWIAARLPSSINTFTLKIPAAIVQYVTGMRFSIQTEDESNSGTVVVDDGGMSWGYSSFLSRHGADENDILIIEFDLLREKVALRLETEDFLDEAVSLIS